eukprot:Colp12_sorted_trinity150504_noHs@15886
MATNPDYQVFEHVVGGHTTKEEKQSSAMLVQDNYILKPMQGASHGQIHTRGSKEASFYESIHGHVLEKFLPKYYGSVTVHIDGGLVDYMKLENITHGMKKPCILDLKMGTQTYGEDASPEKAAKERAKYVHQETIGFRFCGMKVYRRPESFFSVDRKYCMSVEPHTVEEALTEFFNNGDRFRYELVPHFMQRLEAILHAIEKEPTFRFYGSSLLLVYDGAEEEPKIDVRMIDFAHVYKIKDGGVDHGYIHGLKFLMGSLVKLYEKGGLGPLQTLEDRRRQSVTKHFLLHRGLPEHSS